jgi:hypothetical protein
VPVPVMHPDPLWMDLLLVVLCSQKTRPMASAPVSLQCVRQMV